jgi:hypothetical protein
MWIKRERSRHTACQRPLHHEIYSLNAGHLIPGDWSLHNGIKNLTNSLHGQVLAQQLVAFGIQGNDEYIAHIAFIAGPAARNISHDHPSYLSRNVQLLRYRSLFYILYAQYFDVLIKSHPRYVGRVHRDNRADLPTVAAGPGRAE